MRYLVMLEWGINGIYFVWVDDFLGCVVWVGLKVEVLVELFDFIKVFVDWVGEIVPSSIEIDVVDEVEFVIVMDEDIEVFVGVDRDVFM